MKREKSKKREMREEQERQMREEEEDWKDGRKQGRERTQTGGVNLKGYKIIMYFSIDYLISILCTCTCLHISKIQWRNCNIYNISLFFVLFLFCLFVAAAILQTHKGKWKILLKRKLPTPSFPQRGVKALKKGIYFHLYNSYLHNFSIEKLKCIDGCGHIKISIFLR